MIVSTHQPKQQVHREKNVRIAGAGYTTPKQAIRYLADGRAVLNANGELEFVASDRKHQTVQARVAHPAAIDEGNHFQWQRKNSGGMCIWTGRFLRRESR